MYIRGIVADRWEGILNREERSDSPTIQDVERFFERLDQKNYTLIILERDASTHMAVGGGAGQYVVYATYDNETFWNLLRSEPTDMTVPLNVGGQEGHYPSAQVVTKDIAWRAGRSFVEAGVLDQTLKWQK